MAISRSRQLSAFICSGLMGFALIATGCCGPMACGPMGGCGSCSNGPLMNLGCGGGCGGCDGCGETYVDEWVNHPPSCCDPCDSCGNYNGQDCSACRPMFDGFKSLWGYRRDCGCDTSDCGCETSCGSEAPGCGCESGGCDGGCATCAGHASNYDNADMNTQYADSPRYPAPTIVQSQPLLKPYQPQRTKQIFRPKGNSANATVRASHF